MSDTRTSLKPGWRRRLCEEMRGDVDNLLDRGWSISVGANGFKLYNSLGFYAMTIHFSPGDRRCFKNYRATIKQKLQEEADAIRANS